jgi:ketosteroid isomerase-like protein
MADDTAELIRLEHARCAAISEGDLEALTNLLGEDLSHTHITGRTQDKQTYLSGLQGKPRRTSRTEDLKVQIYGDTAVMTGTLVNTFPPSEVAGAARRVELHALQVWAKERGGWRLVAFASSGPRSS